MMSMSQTASTATTARPAHVSRTAFAAIAGMYTVMIRLATSGTRICCRKIVIFAITSLKNGAEDSTATTMANIGGSASSVV